jgi:hypothetical protein
MDPFPPDPRHLGNSRLKALQKIESLVSKNHLSQRGRYWTGGPGATLVLGIADTVKYPYTVAAKIIHAEEWVIRLAESIFCRLPGKDLSEKFAVSFCRAIARLPEAERLDGLYERFVLRTIMDPRVGALRLVAENPKFRRQRDAILAVAQLYEAWIETGKKPPKEKWDDVSGYAWSVAMDTQEAAKRDKAYSPAANATWSVATHSHGVLWLSGGTTGFARLLIRMIRDRRKK